jgi:hypothetical protein
MDFVGRQLLQSRRDRILDVGMGTGRILDDYLCCTDGRNIMRRSLRTGNGDGVPAQIS